MTNQFDRDMLNESDTMSDDTDDTTEGPLHDYRERLQDADIETATITTERVTDGRRFTEDEYSTLLDWFMVSDPWPLTNDEHALVKALLDAEAEAQGYETWVHAYHELNMEEAPQ